MKPLTIECVLVPENHRARLCACVKAEGRLPRITRLMALALHLEGLLRQGKIGDYSSLARLGHVSRARITQVMNLLLLAPDIQEDLLFLPPTDYGRAPIHLAKLQPIARQWNWAEQRRLWAALRPSSKILDNCLEVTGPPR
jgi:hypothetical protein